ncbi:MAG: hypothetical protein MUF02_01780 [Acidobacteria bacterium]|jgi:hypothetical protein|nr:hypothetical protein [Acidobacteriota bacterium]
MKNEEIKSFVQKVINEKIELLLNRIDSFQSGVFRDIEKLKDMDDLAKFTLPKDFAAHDENSEGAEDVKVLNEYVKKISTAANQLQLIGSIIEGLTRFCDRAALFLLRDDKLVGWRGKGFSGENGQISDDELKRIFFSLSANTVLKSVIETKKSYAGDPLNKPDDFLIYNRFGGGKPKRIFVLPFFVKGKPQAVIYADSLAGAPIKAKPIEILATVGELSLDLLPIRQKLLAKIKTQEFVEDTEIEQKSFEQHEEELEKTSAPTRENDPERYARVIINDIILYNKKVVEDGIKNRNLYEVLKETLLQAKELYLRRSSNLRYFEEQMVRLLAKGEREALKGYKFEVYK